MCGICGVVDFGGDPGGEGRIRRMAAALEHRGPDDSGVAVEPPALLGHTRLSIIDLSRAGHQPMRSPDGALTLVYNGEVYNFRELRAELEGRGHRFTGRSDSEVVLAAFREWGEDCFARLNGMFAMAVWDSRTRTLTLARDRFGIKPLHYALTGRRLVFGSEIKAVLAHGEVAPRMSWGFLHEYLYYGNSLWTDTAFEDVRRLLPGTLATFGPDGWREKRYWDLRDLETPPGDLDDWTAGVRERLDAAVRRHLVADVPVGVFLSGGIDSSAVATFAVRHASERLRTFTAGFDHGLDADERPRARRLAERLGTDHRELFIRAGDLRSVIERLVEAHDEPFADAANIPILLLSRALVNEGLKVVLQGDGGDEIFAGYRRYNVLANERWWRLVARPGLAALRAAPASPARQRLARFLRAMAQSDPALRMALLLTMEDVASPPTRVLSPEARGRAAASDPFRAYRAAAAFFEGRDAVNRMLFTDCLLLLPDTFLAKVDRPSMAHSIEVRVPFLDAELTDYAIPLPSRAKVRRLQKKFLLRRALRGIVPDEILDGPKRGLDVPYSRWLRGELGGWCREVLLDTAAGWRSLVDAAALESCVAEHAEGRRDNGFLLYKLLNLALWQRRYGVSGGIRD